MVKQWQNLFFNDNLVETELLSNPKFDKIAEAYGLAYKKVTKLEEIVPALKWAKEEKLPTILIEGTNCYLKFYIFFQTF